MTPEDSATVGSADQSILATISVGAFISILSPDNSNIAAFVANVSDYNAFAIAMGVPQHLESKFEVYTYDYDGDNEAKISLKSSQGTFWKAADELGDLSNIIILDPIPDEFILRDMGGGNISIQNIVAPPGPYIQHHNDQLLHYGFDQPFLQGSFTIVVMD